MQRAPACLQNEMPLFLRMTMLPVLLHHQVAHNSAHKHPLMTWMD